MTFYWWSHWFWITMLSIILFLSTIVHTYPSQEITLQYNQNSREIKAVTKLYQTGPTIKWGTTAPTSTQIMDLTQGGLSKEEKEIEDKSISKEVEEITDKFDDNEELAIEDKKNENENHDAERSGEEFEFKRSAENEKTKTQENQEQPKNDTHESAINISRKPTITMTEDDSIGAKTRSDDLSIVNGQDNFSSNISNLSTNTTQKNTTIDTIDPVHQSPPSAPSPPLINAQPSAAEWLNNIVAQLPPPVSQQSLDDITSNMVTTSSGSQKIPFTLENVNREDELRRAENEHRTRKSKVLSAEYKHINRYINYSSDSKSLLTRSASASPNEFDNDSESNISSEALAIQRTYFLDAGAISAICFTVFGVCCTVGTIGIVLYRRRYINKPQTLSEPDSSVYDDSTIRVSDNSDEMYSLDNDSFLNSLEAMTIQNYWTDTVKHTKL